VILPTPQHPKWYVSLCFSLRLCFSNDVCSAPDSRRTRKQSLDDNEKLVKMCFYYLKCTKFGQMILRKIIKTVAKFDILSAQVRFYNCTIHLELHISCRIAHQRVLVPGADEPEAGAVARSSAAGLCPIWDRVRWVDADVVAEGDSGSSMSDMATLMTMPGHPPRSTNQLSVYPSCYLIRFGHRNEDDLDSETALRRFGGRCEDNAGRLPWRPETPTMNRLHAGQESSGQLRQFGA